MGWKEISYEEYLKQYELRQAKLEARGYKNRPGVVRYFMEVEGKAPAKATEALRNKTLSVMCRYKGRSMTRRERIDNMLKDGLTPASEELPTIQHYPRGYGKWWTQEQQEDFDRRVDAGRTKTEYRMNCPDGSGYYPITKTEHDYALALIQADTAVNHGAEADMALATNW